MSKALKLEKLRSGVVLLTIDLPDSKLNFMSEPVLRELQAALDEIEADSSCKGVILVSGKDSGFGAGADVKQIQALQSQPVDQILEAVEAGKAVFSRLAKLNSIAGIHGICYGGFTELALWCRKRVAAKDEENLKTDIQVPEVNLGFLPGWGGTIMIPRMMGLDQGFRFLTGGKGLNGKKAWGLGLVDDVVSRSEMIERCEAILLGAKTRKASRSVKRRALDFLYEGVGKGMYAAGAKAGVNKATGGHMPAPHAILKLAMKAVAADEKDLPGLFYEESLEFARLANTDVSRNLVGIFFGQTEAKKPPVGVTPAVKIRTVGVLGAGTMGAGIAQSAAYKGFKVVLKDIDQGALDKGMRTIRGLFDDLVTRKKLTRAQADERYGNITATLDYADMADCDMVIEAVAEVMKVKKIVRADCDKAINKPYVFASNTSSLLIAEMAEGHVDEKTNVEPAKYPELMVGLHFFNPVHLMPLVEVVKGSTTSDEALATAQLFALKLGKTTVRTNDAPCFVVNRILVPYMREAIIMAQEGVPIEDIEKVAKRFGMKMGPFSLLDAVGLDIAGHVLDTMYGAFGDRMSAPAILDDLKTLELLGQKGGRGFYLYDADGKKVSVKEGKMFRKKKRYVLNPDVIGAIANHSGRNKKTESEIADRLFMVMVAEAARALEEGVIEDPRQLDIAMIFGTGFPPHTGGLMKWADSIGTSLVCQKLEWLSNVCGPNFAPCDLLKRKAETNEPFIAA